MVPLPTSANVPTRLRTIWCRNPPDRCGQGVIQDLREVFHRNGRSRGKGRHLSQRMHSCVGASGALRQDVFPGQPSNSGRDEALDRGASGLDLPAGEVGSIVGKGKLQVAQPSSGICSRNLRFWPLTCRVAGELVKHCKNRTFLYVPSSKRFTRGAGNLIRYTTGSLGPMQFSGNCLRSLAKNGTLQALVA